MSSPALAFKVAEEAALRGSEALRLAQGGEQVRLYVEVPKNAPLPYVVIGQHEIDPIFGGCGEAHSIVSTVQWWTKDVGERKGSEAVRLQGDAIIAALHVELAIAGHETVLVEMEEPESYGTDPDHSSRGRVAFRYETTARG